MNKPIFNAPNLLTIAAGLGAGLLTANFLLKDPAPEISELGGMPEPAVQVNELRPIALPDLNDVQQDIRNWYGKPLIINFWATWCAPCRREMPLLQLAHETSTAYSVIGIAADRVDDVRSYVAESGYTYPVLTGEQEALQLSEQLGFDFLGLPFTVFADSTGKVLRIHVGEIHAAELNSYVSIIRQLAAGEISSEAAREQMGAIE